MLKLELPDNGYVNGNYFVSYVETGGKTKSCFRVGDTFEPAFPDSIDIKITNQCSNGCPYCHESSCPDGKWFDMTKTLDILRDLSKRTGNPGIELAIGGGNVLEDIDKTLEFVREVNDLGYRPCVTVSLRDFIHHAEICRDTNYYRNSSFMKLCSIVCGLGISIDRCLTKEEDTLIDEIARRTLLRNVVFHVIIGVMPISELMKMTLRVSERYSKTLPKECDEDIGDSDDFDNEESRELARERRKISDACSFMNNYLVLGFKQFGRAASTTLDPSVIDEWKKYIRRVILGLRKSNRETGKLSLSGCRMTNFLFDNLALEQLDLKTALLSAEYDQIYFGDEFSCSMYIDAVEGTFAPTSRDPNRVSWNDTDILSYFKNGKNIYRREG